MHISEGVLSPPVLAAGWGIAAAGIAAGLRKTPTQKLPETALVSAVLFLASLVHVPLGPSSIHLTLLGLAGVLLGWSAIPALFIALLLQGLFFQFGGLLSLGVNTAVMGASALAGRAACTLLPRKPAPLAPFAGGFTAVIAGTALVSLSLCLSDPALAASAALLFAANLPLAAVEGLITAFIIAALSRLAPGYAERPPRR
jgi:cobalt/nickel transport system permease protein